MDQAGAGPVGSCFALPVAFGWKGCFFFGPALPGALLCLPLSGPAIGCRSFALLCRLFAGSFLLWCFVWPKLCLEGRMGRRRAILISMVPGLRLSYTCVTHLYVLLIRDTKKGSAVERAFLFELMGGTKFST